MNSCDPKKSTLSAFLLEPTRKPWYQSAFSTYNLLPPILYGGRNTNSGSGLVLEQPSLVYGDLKTMSDSEQVLEQPPLDHGDLKTTSDSEQVLELPPIGHEDPSKPSCSTLVHEPLPLVHGDLISITDAELVHGNTLQSKTDQICDRQQIFDANFTLSDQCLSSDGEECDYYENFLKYGKLPHYVFRVKDFYVAACRMNGIKTVNSIYTQLGQSEILLSNKLLGSEDIKGLCIALSRCSEVKSLVISNNPIGRNGVCYLADLIRSSESLSSLDCSHVYPGIEDFTRFSQSLMMNKTLTHLNISGNNLSIGHAKMISCVLQVNVTLRELMLNNNKFDEDCGQIIGKAIYHNKSLSKLDLSWNHIRRKGAEAISNALRTNRSLKILNVSWNGFSKEGCKCLALDLPRNKSLNELDISANRINVKAVHFLLEGLVKNRSLITLKIGKNPLTTHAANLIVLSIKYGRRSAIEYLDITDIPVDEVFLNTVRDIQYKRLFRVIHGDLYSREDAREGQLDDTNGLERFHPTLILFEYMKQDNFRLVDLFHYFDVDGTGFIDVSKLREGFKVANIPMTEYSLESLIRSIDTDCDQKISLQDLMISHRKLSRTLAERNNVARKKGFREDPALKDLHQIISGFLQERNEKLKDHSF